jgi:hypothetical protein
MKTKIELHTFATFDEAIFQMNLGGAFLEFNEGKSSAEEFNDTRFSLEDNIKMFDDFIDFLNSSGSFNLRWGVLKTGHFFVIDLEEESKSEED